MARTVPVRIPEGMAAVVSEMSRKLDLDKMTSTTLLLFSGLTHVHPDMFTTATTDLMWIDATEAYVGLVRSLSHHDAEHREKMIKSIGNLYDMLQEFFQKPKKELRMLK